MTGRVDHRTNRAPTWYDAAACRGTNPALWFADTARPALHAPLVAQARTICSTCPVIVDCAEAGRDEPYGVWAGRTPEERGWRSTGCRRSDREWLL